jgi:transglutaminase-like putative cysteine protease
LLYKVIHTTTYTYHEPVSLCQNIARLVPRSSDKQVCKKSVVTIHPQPDVLNEYEDFFGNKLLYFAIQQLHKQLTVTATSEIEKIIKGTAAVNVVSDTSWREVQQHFSDSTKELLDIRQYVPETIITASTPEINAYALQSYTAGRSLYAATFDLMQRIYKDFTFKAGFTTIATPLSVVMKERKGVCQDFAHLAIACIRSMGLPARYVSGYLETLAPPGKEKLTGVDASHAWFAVYIPNIGWVDFDPTNNQIPGEQHITVGWGRDYNDIAPLKGVIINSGPHKLSVSVDVRRIG